MNKLRLVLCVVQLIVMYMYVMPVAVLNVHVWQ